MSDKATVAMVSDEGIGNFLDFFGLHTIGNKIF